jgi:penicillin-binding protein 2
MGLKLGPDKIAKYANAMGLGVITGIDIPSEKMGLIPTAKWKEETKKIPWQAGESLSISVGQGYVSITPLQNAVMIATVANGGKQVVPHLADSLVDPNGNQVYQWQKNSPSEQVIDPEIIKIVKEGLIGVVNSPEGTAYRLKALNMKIAGKTGTAQVISKEQWRSGVEKLKDHAWFVGYAPYDDPKIAVAVIVENGGFGASAAAPVVGQIIKKYLEKEGYVPTN